MKYRVLPLFLAATCLVAQPQFGGGGGRPRPAANGRASANSGTPTTAGTEAPAEKRASLAGQVVAMTGEPLNKVELTLRKTGGGRPEALSAQTDPAGNFTFPDIEAGTYFLSAQRSGYVQAMYGARGRNPRMGSTIRLSPGQELKGVVMKLQRQAVITGKVVDEDGEPVQRAMVQVLSQRYFRGRKQNMPMNGQQANDLGEYRIANLPPGKYLVSVSQQRNFGPGMGQARPTTEGPEEGYVTMYYPGVMEPSQAIPIEVAAGNEIRGIDFQLKKTQVFRVRGKVIDGATNKGAEQVMVMLVPAGAAGSMSFANRSMGMMRNNDGAFELAGVTPGSYILIANRMSRGGEGASAQLPLEVGTANVDNVTIVLSPPIEIPGVVRIESKDKPAFAQTRIMLEPADGFAMNSPNAMVAEDGSFKIPNATAAKYRVNVMPVPDGSYVKALRVGNQEVPDMTIDLTAGVAGPVEVVLSPTAATVEGSVVDPKQKPANGAVVILIPEAAKRDNYALWRQGSTDQTGAFTLKNIPPGEYTLYSWEDIEEGSWQDPDVLRKFDGQGIKLKLGDSGRENVQVKMIASENATIDRDENKDQRQ